MTKTNRKVSCILQILPETLQFSMMFSENSILRECEYRVWATLWTLVSFISVIFFEYSENLNEIEWNWNEIKSEMANFVQKLRKRVTVFTNLDMFWARHEHFPTKFMFKDKILLNSLFTETKKPSIVRKNWNDMLHGVERWGSGRLGPKNNTFLQSLWAFGITQTNFEVEKRFVNKKKSRIVISPEIRPLLHLSTHWYDV